MNAASVSEKEDTDDAPPIPFETWAQIAAKMLERSASQKLDLLESHRVTAEDWTPSDEHWTSVLTHDIATGDFKRADVYAQRCAAELQARKAPEGKPAKEAAKDAKPEPAKEPAKEPKPAPIVEKAAAPKAPVSPLPIVEARPAMVAQERPAMPPRDPLGETHELPNLQAIARTILPLKEGAAKEGAPAPKPVAPPAAAEAKPPSMQSGGDDLGLTLVQYASLCAELELGPERVHDTLSRYRLSVEQKAHLDARFSAQFRSDPHAHASYEHAKSTYAAWLRTTRRGS